jgi:TM2 domain-containing membrane protein YozV
LPPARCSKCGGTTYASTLFCQHCGAALTNTGELTPGPNDWFSGQPAQVQATKKCPFCAETILAEARKCKHCGEMLDERLRTPPTQQMQPQGYYPPQMYYPPPQVWNPGVAAVLSLFMPGAGQMYKGRIGEGIGWLFLTAVGYVFFICPGVLIHMFCILSAAKGDPTRPGG